MTRERIQRWALALIGLFMLPTSIQATFAPESWYDSLPLGRSWVTGDGGTSDEHLVRDVGVLFVALIVAAAWLILGLFHFGYHVGHLDGLDTVDQVGLS